MAQTNLDEVGRIWNWVGVKARQGKQLKQDVILPYGILQETNLNLQEAANKFQQTALLSNRDIVLGPVYNINTADKEQKDLYSTEMNEFRMDMLYLKRAMEHKTIKLNELPTI